MFIESLKSFNCLLFFISSVIMKLLYNYIILKLVTFGKNDSNVTKFST